MAETALVPIEKLDPVALFVKRDIGWVKEVIRKGVDEIIGDATVETAAGRQKIKSAAYQVARSKTLFDKMGKDFTAKLRAELAETNEGRKEIVQWCDDFQREKRQPLTDWEEAEKVRQAEHEDRIQAMKDLAVDRNIQDSYGENLSSSELKKRLSEIESLEMGEVWEEYAAEASQVKDECVAKLKGFIAEREKYEAEQAELERLRKEAEERRQKEETERLERERKEREERIAREAAKKAKRDAEEKAQREREEAERKAYAAIKAKEAVERAAKEAAERAERERIATEERARLEKEFAIKRERERAEAEAKRIEQERKAKEEAERIAAEKKAANKRHRAKINNEVLADFELFGLGEADAKNLIKHMAKGDVRHVTINY